MYAKNRSKLVRGKAQNMIFLMDHSCVNVEEDDQACSISLSFAFGAIQ